MISAPTDQITQAIQNVLLSRNPTQNKLQQLESDMKNILTRTDLPDETKVVLYQQSLQNYLQFDHARKITPLTMTIKAPSDKETTPNSSEKIGNEGITVEQPNVMTETKEADDTSQILKCPQNIA